MRISRAKRPLPTWTLDPEPGGVFSVCHPEWRGVRSSTLAFRSACIESDDLAADLPHIINMAQKQKMTMAVIQGWPPGAGEFARSSFGAGLRVKAVVHSSMAQHTAEGGEASAIGEVVELYQQGVIEQIGFVKNGLAPVFEKAGISATHVPNRVPAVSASAPLDLGRGMHVGVFAEPIWRKNLGTQLGASALMDATAHVLTQPAGVPAIQRVRAHGVLEYAEFLSLLASTDVNLCVTLSECHPMTPMESYALGVPCLISRTSDLFKSDPELWELTSVDELDNPVSVANAASRLIENGSLVVERAQTWLRAADSVAAQAWAAFTVS